MKTFRMKRLLALLTAAILLFGATACTDTTGGTTTPTTAASTTTTAAQTVTTTTVETGTVTTTETETVNTTTKDQTVIPTTTVTKTPTTTVQQTVTTTTQNNMQSTADDRAWQANPGSLYEPIDSHFDAQANAINNNNGKSEATPFQTVDALRYLTFKAGDVVLFERGGLYRVPRQLNLTSGVSYGAYGTGDRPLIYGSTRNYANDQWINVGGNVWTIAATFPGDVGCVVFNHGEKWAQWVETRSELDKEMEFWSDLNHGGKVYLYTTEDPNGKYRSIEIGHDGQLFNFDKKYDITIENLTFKYTGGHATRGANTKNITIRGCEYGFIGGSILHYTAGQATRYGNGAEFMQSSENVLIENCWFYQIYDSATTTQANYDPKIEEQPIAKNYTLRNTLIEYSGMAAYEFWGCKQINITLENNVMRFSGFGHGGMKNSNGFLRSFIQSNYRSASGTPVLYLENFKVKNNVFDQSDYQLINFCFGEQSKDVVVDGNTWCQVKNNKRRPLGYFKVVKQLYFDNDAETTIKNVIGDKNATVTYA